MKGTKAKAVSILLLSEDEKVRHTNKIIKCGRKWKPQKAVKEAEAYWKHQEIVGVVYQERLGLGNYNAKRWSKANAKGKATLHTLTHILTGCPKSLREGRIRWRHDKVLTEIAKWMDLQMVKANR